MRIYLWYINANMRYMHACHSHCANRWVFHKHASFFIFLLRNCHVIDLQMNCRMQWLPKIAPLLTFRWKMHSHTHTPRINQNSIKLKKLVWGGTTHHKTFATFWYYHKIIVCCCFFVCNCNISTLLAYTSCEFEPEIVCIRTQQWQERPRK